jgi:tetratricopeptide (TPR) repeat protein
LKKRLLIFALIALISPNLFASAEAYQIYLHGLIAERKGDLATALQDYQKASEMDPQAIEVYRDLAQLNLRTGHTEAALHAAMRVKDLAPTESSSFLFLGHVYIARGDLSMAAQEYEKALQLDPRNLKALENLGNYYSALNTKKALEYYKRYLEIEPHDAEIFFQMGFLYQKSGDTPAAINAFKKSIEYDPQQVASHLALAELFELKKSTAAAIEQYQECVKLDSRNPAFSARLGHIYFDNKQWDAAAVQFEKAQTLEPQDATNPYYLARIAEEKGDWVKAATLAERAYQLSHDVQFLPLLSYYLTMQHRTKEAVVWLEKAIKAEPNSPNAQLFLGMDYLELDQPKKARDVLEKAVAAHPQDTQLRFQLGIAYDRLGEFEKAEREFNLVLKMDPKNAPALNYLGYSFAERGIRLEEGEAHLLKAVKIDPQNGAYWDSLGWIRYKLGHYAQASADLEKASILSQDSLIYEHLGDACAADQKMERALSAWTKSIALNPNNKPLEKKIQDASRHAIAGTNQRRYLKSVQGNFHQISDLRGSVQVEGRWEKAKLKTQGGVYYLAPDRLMLAIGPSEFAGQTDKAPSARVSVKGQTVDLKPPEIGDPWKHLGQDSLSWLQNLFSGKLVSGLYDSSQITQNSKAQLHFQNAAEEAWVDPSRGVLLSYSRENSAGGRDHYVVDSYDLVEGLWLPRQVRMENSKQGWKAQMLFSNWQINEPHTAHVFEQP